jgi:hypothetical protein
MSFAAAEGNAETFETFDSFEEVDAPSEDTSDDDWSKPEPESKEKVKDEGLKVLDDSNVDAEGKVIKDDKEEKKSEKKAEKKEDEEEEEEVEESDEESEEEKSEEEESEEEKKPKSKLRMRMGDELYNVDSDATLPVKIDGKVENVPVQELINNYSGKTAWDKKFTEIGKEKKALEFEKSQITAQKNKLVEHVNNALIPLKDPAKNPLDSLLYLVEMSGEDPYTAYRRIMEANLEELSSLMDMTETERELHFHKKKDELHGKVAKQRQAKAQEEQSFNQISQKVDALRQAHNVSEDEFVEASEELETLFTESKLDPESITPEQVVDYASLKPHIAKVKQLIGPYEENISEEKYGDVVAQLSRYLRDGKVDEKRVAEILKRNYSVEEEVKELNTKIYQKNAAKKPAKKVEAESSMVETFDDWD